MTKLINIVSLIINFVKESSDVRKFSVPPSCLFVETAFYSAVSILGEVFCTVFDANQEPRLASITPTTTTRDMPT